MMGTYENFKTSVTNLGVDFKETDFYQRGYHLDVVLTVNTVRKFAQTAYDQGFYLVFVAGFTSLQCLTGFVALKPACPFQRT